MAENLLDQIDAKIQRKEKVRAGDISDAYKTTYENHMKEYLAGGGKAEDFETAEANFIARLREQRDRQVKENGDLSEKLEQERLAVVDNTKSKEREMKYKTSVERAWAESDPDGKGWLKDYEGTGKLNRLGWGRTTWSGALAALEMCDHKLVEKITKNAKGVYKNKLVDESLDDKDIVKLLGGDKYLNPPELKDVNLTNQARGFVAGYLRAADLQLTDTAEKAEYKKILLQEVQKLAAKFQVEEVREWKFTHELKGADNLTDVAAGVPKGVLKPQIAGLQALVAPLSGFVSDTPLNDVFHRTESFDSEKERSEEQMEAFKELATPLEWKHQWTERLKKTLEPFQKNCNEIIASKGNADFQFKDPLILEMMAKKPEDLTFSDEQKLLEAQQKARDEVYPYLQEKKDKTLAIAAENRKLLAALKARNKALKTPVVSDEELNSLEKVLNNQSLDLDAVGIAPNSSLEDLTAMWKKMVSIRDSDNLAKAKYEEFDRRIKDGVEKEPGIQAFLNAKGLSERYDDKAKKYAYELKDADVKVDGGRISMNFKNPEAAAALAARFNALNASLKGKRLTTDDDLKLQKAKDIALQAVRDSAFTLDQRPTAGELQDAYNAKFKPAWERAATAFDDQLRVPFTPVVPVGPGGGGDRPSRNPDRRDGGSDPYPEKWKHSKEIPMPKEYYGFSGGLEVTNNDGLHLRSVSTHKVLQTLEKEEGANENSITLADPKGKALEVNGRIFVKIKYKNRTYFARLDHMAKNAASKNLDSGDKGKKSEKPGSKIDKDIKFLGNVRGEYREILAKIWKERESGSVEFLLPYNKVVVRCTLRHEGGDWILSWPANNSPTDRGSLRFASLEEAMREINDGRFAQDLMWETIRNENVYKPYKYGMGEVQKLKVVPSGNGLQSAIELELDWHGGGIFDNGNPQVILTAMPYGHIHWTVNREKSGPAGQGSREGEAASFEDFARQMEHAKRWNENYDKTKMTDAVVRPESLYTTITNPSTFRQYEKAIGHIVSFEVTGNELVQMFLDWGGGSSQDTAKNAMLNVWVDGQGRLNYILNFKGTVTRKGFAQNVEDIAKVVGETKRFALGQ